MTNNHKQNLADLLLTFVADAESANQNLTVTTYDPKSGWSRRVIPTKR